MCVCLCVFVYVCGQCGSHRHTHCRQPKRTQLSLSTACGYGCTVRWCEWQYGARTGVTEMAMAQYSVRNLSLLRRHFLSWPLYFSPLSSRLLKVLFKFLSFDVLSTRCVCVCVCLCVWCGVHALCPSLSLAHEWPQRAALFVLRLRRICASVCVWVLVSLSICVGVCMGDTLAMGAIRFDFFSLSPQQHQWNSSTGDKEASLPLPLSSPSPLATRPLGLCKSYISICVCTYINSCVSVCILSFHCPFHCRIKIILTHTHIMYLPDVGMSHIKIQTHTLSRTHTHTDTHPHFRINIPTHKCPKEVLKAKQKLCTIYIRPNSRRKEQ